MSVVTLMKTTWSILVLLSTVITSSELVSISAQTGNAWANPDHTSKSSEGKLSTAHDRALLTGFQDYFGGHFKRGRALVAADFDLDGRVDFFVGNPGEESFVLRNLPDEDTGYRFERTQVLLNGDLAWGAVASDFDNDGDYDLFVTCGGNEGIGFDYLFRNDFVETGKLHFTDVSEKANISGPVPANHTAPIKTASANARLADYDQDGDVDIFVSNNHIGLAGMLIRSVRGHTPFEDVFVEDMQGRNILWRNEGELRFENVTDEVGLSASKGRTRHSTWLDIDNDGDMDLFENNMGQENKLWRNLLVERDKPSFKDVTDEMSLPGEDLAYPLESFVSASADFDNDGWEDIFVFARNVSKEYDYGPYKAGHALFLNVHGTGFRNIAEATGVNKEFPAAHGTMGSQIGDVSGDGFPDIFFGNGSPNTGSADQLLISDVKDSKLSYIDASYLIDFPAPENKAIDYPKYPYRTHGTTFVDVDNDGALEIAVVNGGPARMPNAVRAPNRLFDLDFPGHSFLKVNLEGDGKHVSRDAIGTRIALRYTDKDGVSETIYRTLHGGSAFSAQNGFTSHFYLSDEARIDSLIVTWPNGWVDTITNNINLNSTILLVYPSNFDSTTPEGADKPM